MRTFVLLITFMVLPFAALQCVYDVNADNVQLKNGALILSGNVSLSLDNTTIHSEKMILSFDRGQLNSKTIENLVAEGNVMIDHQKLFSATGQRAVYNSGTVILYPDEENSHCTISNEQGLLIKMAKAVYTPETRELILINPDGHMKLDMDGGGNHLHFQSEQLIWDNTNQQLTLIDDVKIQVPGIASLVNDDRVSLTWADVSGKILLHRITSSGKSELQKYDSEGDACFIVEDEGITCYDVIEGRVSFTSDPDHEIHYYDRFGHVFGRELFVDLLPNSTVFSLQKIYLNRDVKLLTGVIIVEGELKGATQYVLSDSLVVDPKINTLVMKSSDNRRVLYCDRMNHLQMSAPKLVIKQDPGMERPSIKGIGDVRFRLKEQELEQIKKRFYFDEGEQES